MDEDYAESKARDSLADAKSESGDSDSAEEEIAEQDFPEVPLAEGEATIASSLRAHEVISGFRMYIAFGHFIFTCDSHWMNMRDADTGELMWQSRNWDKDIFEREEEGTILRIYRLMTSLAHIPAAVLKCSAISREMNFSSHIRSREKPDTLHVINTYSNLSHEASD